MNRAQYILYRTVQTVFLLWFVLTFLFFLFRAMPGSYVDVMMTTGATQEGIEAFKQKWGLNQPLHVQYYQYMINFVQGDAGTTFQTNEPVWDFVAPKIFNTFILIAPAVTFAYILGAIFGSLLGVNRGSKFEQWGVSGAIFSGSFPEFFTAIILVIVFSGWLNLFPPTGLASIETQTSVTTWWGVYLTKDFLYHYTLPFSAVVLRYFFLPTLTMRTSVVEVSGQDFMYYHRVSGLPYIDRLKRLIRHASLPVITLYPVSMTRAISGLVLIETVFNWPGIGHALVTAVFARDFAVVQFVFFVAAAFVILANFGVDLLYTVIDPRVSVGSE